jgi:hypothetical protein
VKTPRERALQGREKNMRHYHSCGQKTKVGVQWLTKVFTWAHTCHSSYEESINRRVMVQASLGITRAKRAGGMAQVVEYLPADKYKALSSNPNSMGEKGFCGLYITNRGNRKYKGNETEYAWCIHVRNSNEKSGVVPAF